MYKDKIHLNWTWNNASKVSNKQLQHLLFSLTWISRKPNALPIVVAVKSLPPLPSVVTAQVLQPYMKIILIIGHFSQPC